MMFQQDKCVQQPQMNSKYSTIMPNNVSNESINYLQSQRDFVNNKVNVKNQIKILIEERVNKSIKKRESILWKQKAPRKLSNIRFQRKIDRIIKKESKHQLAIFNNKQQQKIEENYENVQKIINHAYDAAGDHQLNENNNQSSIDEIHTRMTINNTADGDETVAAVVGHRESNLIKKKNSFNIENAIEFMNKIIKNECILQRENDKLLLQLNDKMHFPEAANVTENNFIYSCASTDQVISEKLKSTEIISVRCESPLKKAITNETQSLTSQIMCLTMLQNSEEEEEEEVKFDDDHDDQVKKSKNILKENLNDDDDDDVEVETLDTNFEEGEEDKINIHNLHSKLNTNNCHDDATVEKHSNQPIVNDGMLSLIIERCQVLAFNNNKIKPIESSVGMFNDKNFTEMSIQENNNDDNHDVDEEEEEEEEERDKKTMEGGEDTIMTIEISDCLLENTNDESYAISTVVDENVDEIPNNNVISTEDVSDVSSIEECQPAMQNNMKFEFDPLTYDRSLRECQSEGYFLYNNPEAFNNNKLNGKTISKSILNFVNIPQQPSSPQLHIHERDKTLTEAGNTLSNISMSFMNSYDNIDSVRLEDESAKSICCQSDDKTNLSPSSSLHTLRDNEFILNTPEEYLCIHNDCNLDEDELVESTKGVLNWLKDNLKEKMFIHVVNRQDKCGNTLLHLAVGLGYWKLVDILLCVPELDLSIRNNTGYMSFMLTASMKIRNTFEFDCLVRLIKTAADQRVIDAKANNIKNSPLLCLAAECGNCTLVELILSCGTNVNIADNRGFTPLMLAAANAHLDIVNILLKMPEINVKLTNLEEKNAWDIAIAFGCQDIALSIYKKAFLSKNI